MPAKFHLVSPGVWTRTFRQLDPAAQVVAFNVWTCRNRVSEGLYELSPGHISADTGLSVEAVEAALAALHAANIVNYDQDAEVVLDRGALKANPLRNGVDKKTGEEVADKRIKGAVELFVRVADSPLKLAFLALADEHSPDLAAAIRDRLDLPPPEQPEPPVSPSQGATQGASPPSGSPSEGGTQGASRSEAQRGEVLRAREDLSNGSSGLVKDACSECEEPGGWCRCPPPSNPERFDPAELIKNAMPWADVS